ncbi:MAG: hypothetical protein Q6K70_03095 [Thermostichales cyanobacterium DRC_bins_46]
MSWSVSLAQRISRLARQQDTAGKIRSFRQQAVVAALQPLPPPPPAGIPDPVGVIEVVEPVVPTPVEPVSLPPPVKVLPRYAQGPARGRVAARLVLPRAPRANVSQFWQGSQPRIAALPHPKPWRFVSPVVQPLPPSPVLAQPQQVTPSPGPAAFQPVYSPPPRRDPLFPQGPAKGRIAGVRPRLPGPARVHIPAGSSQTAKHLRAIQAQKRRWSAPAPPVPSGTDRETSPVAIAITASPAPPPPLPPDPPTRIPQAAEQPVAPPAPPPRPWWQRFLAAIAGLFR